MVNLKALLTQVNQHPLEVVSPLAVFCFFRCFVRNGKGHHVAFHVTGEELHLVIIAGAVHAVSPQRNCTREDVTTVVVGVFPDHVDPARGEEEVLALRCKGVLVLVKKLLLIHVCLPHFFVSKKQVKLLPFLCYYHPVY